MNPGSKVWNTWNKFQSWPLAAFLMHYLHWDVYHLFIISDCLCIIVYHAIKLPDSWAGYMYHKSLFVVCNETPSFLQAKEEIMENHAAHFPSSQEFTHHAQDTRCTLAVDVCLCVNTHACMHMYVFMLHAHFLKNTQLYLKFFLLLPLTVFSLFIKTSSRFISLNQ